jgi:hypothetical protein
MELILLHAPLRQGIVLLTTFRVVPHELWRGGLVHAYQVLTVRVVGLYTGAAFAQTYIGERRYGALDISSGDPQAPFSAWVLFPQAAVNLVT